MELLKVLALHIHKRVYVCMQIVLIYEIIYV